jgi:hypothetical protein
MRAGAAVLDQVDLVGGDEQVAARDGDRTFRRDARGKLDGSGRRVSL